MAEAVSPEIWPRLSARTRSSGRPERPPRLLGKNGLIRLVHAGAPPPLPRWVFFGLGEERVSRVKSARFALKKCDHIRKESPGDPMQGLFFCAAAAARFCGWRRAWLVWAASLALPMSEKD